MDERFSEEWLAAMRAPVRRERVRLALSRGGEKHDGDIIKGSLYINRKVMGGKFDIGTCCLGEMGVSFIDDNAIDTDYGGAVAVVEYGLCVGADKWELHTAGPFIIDGQKARRSDNVVTIKAYDVISSFDIELPKSDIPEFANLYEAVLWLCGLALSAGGVQFGIMPESEFNMLPNADVVPDFTSGQIVSCRDALMWIAQATGSCVYYGRQGVTFKQYKYTGNMTHDREITVDEREKTEFTDTRTYCAYMSAYCADSAKIYSNITEFDESWDPQYIKTGGLSIPKNPIIANLSTARQDEVNRNIIKSMSYPTRYVKMTGDVDFLLEPLDCAAFTGGSIDIRKMIIAPVTEINWKYRGTGKIVCTNVEEYNDPLPDEVTPAALSDGISVQTAAPTIRSPVYPQSEKAIQGVSMTALIGNFGGKYALTWTSQYSIAAFDPDRNQLFQCQNVPGGGIKVQFAQKQGEAVKTVFNLDTGGGGLRLDSGNVTAIISGDHMEVHLKGKRLLYLRDDGYVSFGNNNDFWANPSVGAFKFKGFEVNTNSGTISLNNQTVFKTIST